MPQHKACNQLGAILFQSGIAEAFNITHDQAINSTNPNVLALVGFILAQSDATLATKEGQEMLQEFGKTAFIQ